MNRTFAVLVTGDDAVITELVAHRVALDKRFALCNLQNSSSALSVPPLPSPLAVVYCAASTTALSNSLPAIADYIACAPVLVVAHTLSSNDELHLIQQGIRACILTSERRI
ncbi:MAG TPA: hypothetical protein PL009_01220 [Flavipsychrobacter sp.]|nr:hypothetical protein [Flavipsychrobacter sp.]